jgi:predicted nucleotidyltransferase
MMHKQISIGMLSKLFKTEERIKILYYVLYREESSVSKAARETGTNKGLVSRYLDMLAELDLILRKNRTYHLAESPKVRAIKVLLNLEKIKVGKIRFDWIRGLGIFGSWAIGTNTVESDLDVWVRADSYPPELEIAKLQDILKTMAGCETNLVVLTPQKMKEIREKDAPFYNSLLRESIVLAGENIERMG